MIRSVETNASDKIMCIQLAQGAVHGAFAGFTGFTVGCLNNHAAYLPIDLVVCAPKLIDIRGKQWQRVMETTGQPHFPSGAEDEEPRGEGDERDPASPRPLAEPAAT